MCNQKRTASDASRRNPELLFEATFIAILAHRYPPRVGME